SVTRRPKGSIRGSTALSAYATPATVLPGALDELPRRVVSSATVSSQPARWRSRHPNTRRRTDPAIHRGGDDPQAPNWSLEPAGSQSETGPTRTIVGPVFSFPTRKPHV